MITGEQKSGRSGYPCSGIIIRTAGKKIGSGQYIVGRPPKKPGGRRPKKTPKGYWKMVLLAMLNALAECSADSDQLPRADLTQNIKGFDYYFLMILKLVMIFGLILSRKEILQFPVKLLAGIELIHEFERAVEAFIDRFESDRRNSSTVHSVLFKCLCRDAPLTAKGDPKERVEKNLCAN